MMTASTGAAQPVASTIKTFMPAGYREVGRRAAVVDGQNAELVRYERTDGRNAALGGEHFSTVIADGGRLKGFARMDLELVGGKLPTHDEAQAIAWISCAKQRPTSCRCLASAGSTRIMSRCR